MGLWRSAGRGRRGVTAGSTGRLARTIRGRILLAFVAMSATTAALGSYGTWRIRQAGGLAGATFDESLMSVSYARAAAADFAALQIADLRRQAATSPPQRHNLDIQIGQLRKAVAADLEIAGERSQSPRAREASGRAVQAIAAWDAARAAMPAAPASPDQGGATFDEQVAAINQQIDLLVNYTVSDGFHRRHEAKAMTTADIRANLIGTGLALLLSTLVVWRLARQIIGPVAAASCVARQIADGKLDCDIPKGNGDELGALLSAMEVMRRSLRVMVEREIAQRRSAQTRLADALDNSQEGIVVIDDGGCIAMANARCASLLAISPHVLKPGTPVAALAAATGMALLSAPATAHGDREGPLRTDGRLADGRWLRVSRSATREKGFVAVISDLTLLKEHEERLRATNASFDAALGNMSQGLCLYDAQGRLMVVNSRFNEIFHLASHQVRAGLTFDEVFDLKVAAGNYGHKSLDEIAALRAAQAEQSSGETIFEELAHGQTVAIAHRTTADGGWVATYEDVTKRRYAEKQMLFLARHDALTRLANRTLFGERIEQALAQLARGNGFAVLCLDLDRFKQVNDTLGHPAGDELLRRVADRLQGCVRETDTVARLGGDEFAVIQTNIERPEQTYSLARRMVEAVGAPVEIEGQTVSVGVSIGISVPPADGLSGSALLKNADAALYRAKADGRGTWRCFEPEMDIRLQARRALEADLRVGVEARQFQLLYQPICDLRRDRICGFEALLRWNHPEKGCLPPSDFLALAEEIGVIRPLGEWVLRAACAEASRWPAHVKVAVNVSSAQFVGSNLVAAVEQALAETGLAPARLELEVTEMVLLTNTAATLDMLHRLRRRGVRVVMDDFGTGYSSLSHLRSFPFDKLKIDESFTRDLTAGSESGVIVRAMTGLGSNLGMSITAEGVETAEQLGRLRQDGCHEAQGRYFSPPVAAADVPVLLARWNAAAAA